MALRDVVRKVYNKLLVNNEGYLKYLRSCGVTIGEDVTFHCPGDRPTPSDNRRPR